MSQPVAKRVAPSESQVRRWLGKLLPPGVHQLFVKGHRPERGGKPVNLIGYYDNIAALAGAAYEYSGRATSVFVSLNPRLVELHARSPNELSPRVKAGRNEDVVRRLRLLVDVDVKRLGQSPASDSEKERAKKTTQAIRKSLRKRGWPDPIVADSGNGFHLLYRIDLPTDDGGLVGRVLNVLSEEFSDDRVDIDTSVHDAARLVRVPGTQSRKGQSTAKRPYRHGRLAKPPTSFDVVTREQLEELVSGAAVTEVSGPSLPPSPSASPGVISAARKYTEKVPAAISGQHGHRALFAVACRLVIDFALGLEDALPILRSYNERCEPPWKDEDLQRKLREADQQEGERGKLARTTGRAVTAGETNGDGPRFHGHVPDFTLCESQRVYLRLKRFNETNWFDYAFLWAVWQQQRSDAVVPDVMLRDAWWGATPPRNWRRDLKQKVGLELVEETEAGFGCPSHCPLHNTGVQHKHFRQPAGVDHGVLDRYFTGTSTVEPTTVRDSEDECDAEDLQANPVVGKQVADWTDEDWEEFEADIEADLSSDSSIETPASHCKYTFFDGQEEQRSLRKSLRSNGDVFNVYWPVLLFGDSPRVDLSGPQQRLLLAITRELTHARDSHREDRAALYLNARVPNGKRGELVECHILDSRRPYVLFGGNGAVHFHGQGYRLFGGGWLVRAGYRDGDFDYNVMADNFLSDLAVLAEHFELTVAAKGKDGKWYDLATLRNMQATGRGREIGNGCRIRILAPEDSLVLWRRWFAERLGFGWIPEHRDDQVEFESQDDECSAIRTAADVRDFLDEYGLTQRELAKELGCSRERVSRHLNGHAANPRFFAEVDALTRKWATRV